MGLSNIAPPSASVRCVHSQPCRCSEELSRNVLPREVSARHDAAFGPDLPRSGLVPSLPFLPASTVCSALAPFQACCILKPIMGFTRFQPERHSSGLFRAVLACGCGPSPPCRRRHPRGAACHRCRLPTTSTASEEDDHDGQHSDQLFRMLLGIPAGASPSEAFPLTAAKITSTDAVEPHPSSLASTGEPVSTCHLSVVRPNGVGPPRPVPSRRYSRFRPPSSCVPQASARLWSAVAACSASGRSSTAKSVATARRFHRTVARCFHGLCPLEGLPFVMP